MNKPYSVRHARYAKGKMVVSANKTDGWKNRFDRLVEALGGKWVHRDHDRLYPDSCLSWREICHLLC